MQRAKPIESDEIPGGDSFLDIVANIVGILVLLVVVVGVRAGREVFSPSEAPPETQDSLESLEQELAATVRQGGRDRRESAQLRDKILASALETKRREREREDLVAYVTTLRAELDEAQQDLSEGDQRNLQTSNAIAQAQLTLERLSREQIALAAQEPEPNVETVTVAPTPIIDGRAEKTISFRLKGDRLVYVPVSELGGELQKNLQAPIIRDPSRPVRTTEKLGPVEGFGAEAEIVWSVQMKAGRVRVLPSLSKLVLEEVTELRGEDAQTAFGPGGYVASRLELLDPEQYVIRLIIYADSFEAAPDVGDRFRERGFRVAQSLENQNSPIGFSSDGYKAVTQ